LGELRFSECRATLTTVTVAGIALARLLGGSSPMELADPTAGIEVYQALTGTVGVSLLIHAVMTSERARAEATSKEERV
jgi:hypothetical protein